MLSRYPQLLYPANPGLDTFATSGPFEDLFGSRRQARALDYQLRATRDRRFISFPFVPIPAIAVTATDRAQKNSAPHHLEQPLLYHTTPHTLFTLVITTV
jgi:hypothetical protein